MNFIQSIYSIFFHRKQNTIPRRTVIDEANQYEQSILSRFLSTCFIQPNQIDRNLVPNVVFKELSNGGILSWYKLIFSWYIHRIFYGKQQNKEKNKQQKEQILLRNPRYNENIDSIFLNRDEYKEYMKIPENDLEKKWRTRILIENTPRGNIIMYYDAYKEAFAYYSDQYGIPYRILNIVAMKYVMKFRCVDFFIDELALYGSKNPSLFIDIINNEMKEEKEKKAKSMNHLVKSNMTQNLPFVQTKKESKKEPKKLELQEEKMKNRFIHAGKIHNFSILQLPKKHKTVNKALFSDKITEYDEMFSLQKEAEQNRFDYKKFKQMKQHVIS